MAALSLILAKSAADEGKDIVLSMLVVGLVFVAVIVIGGALAVLAILGTLFPEPA